MKRLFLLVCLALCTAFFAACAARAAPRPTAAPTPTTVAVSQPTGSPTAAPTSPQRQRPHRQARRPSRRAVSPAGQDGTLVKGTGGQPWWNDSTFYEIFVRSFADSDGDGVGDLNGLIGKLDYLNDGDPTTAPISASPASG